MGKNAENTTFTPILTVLPEFGGPFIWVLHEPNPLYPHSVGPCMCDCMGWHEDMPLSEGLFDKFWDWTESLDQTDHYWNGFGDDWDWDAFHARGLHLSRWLKDEVGDAYRVIYCKSPEDPNEHIDRRTEILANGDLRVLA